MMRIRLLVGVLAGLIAISAAAAAADISGQPVVIDGDSLRFGKVAVRLHGIDAPEIDQRGGRLARRHLLALVDDQTVECEARDRDRYGRVVAECFAGGVNLGAAMVADGYALAFIRYSMDYVSEEADARLAGVGIWGLGEVVAPADHRRSAPLLAANDNRPAVRPAGAIAPHDGACPVKVSVGGIAHDVTSRWYARTKRYRCFATLADAIDAGARLPQH